MRFNVNAQDMNIGIAEEVGIPLEILKNIVNTKMCNRLFSYHIVIQIRNDIDKYHSESGKKYTLKKSKTLNKQKT